MRGLPKEAGLTRFEDLSETKQQRALVAAAAIYLGATRAEASGEAGIAEKTLRAWSAEPWWSEVEEIVHEDTLGYLEAKARGVVLQKLREGDGITARWLLERRDDSFKTKTEVKHTGQIDHAHTLEADRRLASLSDEQLARLAQADDDVIDLMFEEARPIGLLDEEE